MFKRKKLRQAVCSALAIGLGMSLAGPALAQEKTEYNLDPVIVTAMREQSTDLKTPAYVNVYDQEKLKATGATNLLDALKYTEGITYDGYGAQGHLYSSMTAKAVIRGMDRGTVVLVDGVPTNLAGYYALEHIPLSNIERVEIVKGASSVLYGTAAMGGVINIITKKKVENRIELEQGSFGINRQTLSLQAGTPTRPPAPIAGIPPTAAIPATSCAGRGRSAIRSRSLTSTMPTASTATGTTPRGTPCTSGSPRRTPRTR